MDDLMKRKIVALLDGHRTMTIATQIKMPAPDEVAIFRVVPKFVSVLDYTKGFAHADLVTC